MRKTIFIFTALLLLNFNSVFARIVVCLNFGNGQWHCNVLEGDCSMAGGEGLSDFGGYSNGRFCKQLMILPKRPPIIRIDRNGRAFLDNNGQITQIASDKIKRFFENSNKITKTDMTTFLKNDDGIVSQKRLETIAKELNAKIEKSNKSISANYCPACEEKK
ncbi:hypothetical protein [Emticicia sp. SJ17W-69]|uniref:hypothetical protein n=1 Tax=Emticicia sp. SJ17W-69 TaxID=3421657 RepID=UPI003EB858C0